MDDGLDVKDPVAQREWPLDTARAWQSLSQPAPAGSEVKLWLFLSLGQKRESLTTVALHAMVTRAARRPFRSSSAAGSRGRCSSAIHSIQRSWIRLSLIGCDCEDCCHALLVLTPFHSLLHSTAAAFVAPSADRASTALAAERREFLAAAAAAAGLALSPLAANAIRDYENIGYLGGSEVVDVNNANVRVYLKMPGLYPTVAGKIASHGPYSSVGDLYNIPGLSGKEKELIKKYESRFTAQKPAADYVIDKINNGL